MTVSQRAHDCLRAYCIRCSTDQISSLDGSGRKNRYATNSALMACPFSRFGISINYRHMLPCQRPWRLSQSLSKAPLLHLESQQVCFWTACGRSMIPILLIESIAAFIQLIDNCLAFLFFIVLFLEAVWEQISGLSPSCMIPGSRQTLYSALVLTVSVEKHERHQLTALG
jgi:hypothetical protein